MSRFLVVVLVFLVLVIGGTGYAVANNLEAVATLGLWPTVES